MTYKISFCDNIIHIHYLILLYIAYSNTHEIRSNLSLSKLKFIKLNYLKIKN